VNLLPVIARELRQQARALFTYNLRVLGAGALLLVGGYVVATFNRPASELGAWLFGCLNAALFGAIWILTPLTCADCLSREKREGTMGLLLLTPLKAWEIVAAKGAVHGIRAFTLLLVVAPVMTIPVLMGGVGWSEIAASFLNNFSALGLALAGSLIASSATRRWLSALLLAFVFAAIFVAALAWMIGVNAETEGGTSSSTTLRDFINPPDDWPIYRCVREILLPFSVVNSGAYGLITFSKLPAIRQTAILRGDCVIAGLSILTILAAVPLAAWIVRRTWREKIPGPFQRWVARTFCTPSFAKMLYRRWSRGNLERNPVGWLGRRHWLGRLGTWFWLLLVLLPFCVPIWIQKSISFGNLRWDMSWLLVGGLAIGSARGFRDERESGLMELLLVSPLGETRIILGRLWGLCAQFLPAFAALLLLGWMLSSRVALTRDLEPTDALLPIGSFIALPVIGLYQSLRRASFIGAFLGTIWVGLVIPGGLKLLLVFAANILEAQTTDLYPPPEYTRYFSDQSFTVGSVSLTPSFWFAPFFQLILTGWAGRRLHRTLVRRNFAFSKMTSG